MNGSALRDSLRLERLVPLRRVDAMHDANQGSYSRSSRVNRALGYTLDLVGASSYRWRHKHNALHHCYPDVVGLDADIDAAPFLRD